MQLIIIDSNENVQYYDKFKLRIDSRCSKEQLIIMPLENENDFIYITFKRKFVHQNMFQRLICIDECEADSKRYILIFVNVEKCIKFIESVKYGKAKDKLIITLSSDEQIFKRRYLTPLAVACQADPLMEEELQLLLFEFLEFYKRKEANISLAAATKTSSSESSNSIVVNGNCTAKKSKATDQVKEETVSKFSNSVNTNDSIVQNGIAVAEALSMTRNNNVDHNDDDENAVRSLI